MTAFVAVLFLKNTAVGNFDFFRTALPFGDILLEIRVKLSPKRE